MDVELDMWKQTLSQGKPLVLKVSGDNLSPALVRGDSVTVKRFPFEKLIEDDVVLCDIGGKVGLRKIVEARNMYGARSVKVAEAGGSPHSVQERTVLGKVVEKRNRDGTSNIKVGPISRFFKFIKSILLPGT